MEGRPAKHVPGVTCSGLGEKEAATPSAAGPGEHGRQPRPMDRVDAQALALCHRRALVHQINNVRCDCDAHLDRLLRSALPLLPLPLDVMQPAADIVPHGALAHLLRGGPFEDGNCRGARQRGPRMAANCASLAEPL